MIQTKTTTETLLAYLQAFGTKDWNKLRSLMTPDFAFTGPLMRFDAREPFIEAMKEMPFEGLPEKSRFIADGNKVVHAFNWNMTAPDERTIPMCELYEIEGDQIRSVELFFDSKLFPKMDECTMGQ